MHAILTFFKVNNKHPLVLEYDTVLYIFYKNSVNFILFLSNARMSVESIANRSRIAIVTYSSVCTAVNDRHPTSRVPAAHCSVESPSELVAKPLTDVDDGKKEEFRSLAIVLTVYPCVHIIRSRIPYHLNTDPYV